MTFGPRFLESHLKRIWQPNRYIKIKSPVDDDNVHYEVCNRTIELHFEGEDYESKYGAMIDYLMQVTDKAPNYRWSSSGDNCYRCSYAGSTEDARFHDIIKDFTAKFDELIVGYLSSSKQLSQNRVEIKAKPIKLGHDLVNLRHLLLEDVLSLPLNVPDYQRAYCWEADNVKLLLDDIREHIETGAEAPYRLGCIILHCHDRIYDIIDGQQRLITLSLLCNELNIDCPLLDTEFANSESIAYIAYNKELISRFCQRIGRDKASFARHVLSKIEFSVLILQNSSIDLAYTFFSHQNSRGVGLSDYDLLKAHHLRYIPTTFERQAYRATEVWNAMIEKGHIEKSDDRNRNNSKADYEVALDCYIYNLRKWLRHLPGGDNGSTHRIKKEYEAAPIIDEIPPFGERFNYSEPIQGGAHFFAWVQKHISEYDTFASLPIITLLRNKIFYGTDVLYRNAIEALIFAYYLKFKEQYITEAFLAILRIVLEHRYVNKRAINSSLLEYVSSTNIVQIIELATSPTFVLAELQNMARGLTYPRLKDMRPIQKSMRSKANDIVDTLTSMITIESFKTLN